MNNIGFELQVPKLSSKAPSRFLFHSSSHILPHMIKIMIVDIQTSCNPLSPTVNM
ncbi:hypothetical protein CAAN1_27S00210 [[Candida] anglica]|uniref:Uncharacterized protein n=1 Tax=[Candida] anglica TaxID=148631 RepID=A0ABP0E7W4_9ASCO